MREEQDQQVIAGAKCFATTHWSVVLAARDVRSPEAEDALAQLCRCYCNPLYAYVRRRGHEPQDAEDLIQEFFSRLLQKDLLKGVQQERGKFRWFLLAALKRFLVNEWKRQNAAKRGGRHVLISLDATAAENRFHLEVSDGVTPEKLFDQSWAVNLLEAAQEQLRREYDLGGRSAAFEGIKIFLSGDEAAHTYAETGKALGLSEGAVKVAVHRLRQRYRECLREQIGQTVSTPGEVDEEIRHLFAVFSG